MPEVVPMPAKLIRKEPGLYTFGPFTLRGIARRWDGRDGSRINYWLVKRDGILVGSGYHTLAIAKHYLQQTLDAEARIAQ